MYSMNSIDEIRGQFPALGQKVWGKPLVYLDNGATSFHKPVGVIQAVNRALQTCANPGRGGYAASMAATRAVFGCRNRAAALFGCTPELVVFTCNCTHGLNMAIGTLIKPGARVVISGFEHNAVTRPLHALQAQITVAGRNLFDREDTLRSFEAAMKKMNELMDSNTVILLFFKFN